MSGGGSAGGVGQLVDVGGVDVGIKAHPVKVGGGCGIVDGFSPNMGGGGYSTIGAAGSVHKVGDGFTGGIFADLPSQCLDGIGGVSL